MLSNKIQWNLTTTRITTALHFSVSFWFESEESKKNHSYRFPSIWKHLPPTDAQQCEDEILVTYSIQLNWDWNFKSNMWNERTPAYNNTRKRDLLQLLFFKSSISILLLVIVVIENRTHLGGLSIIRIHCRHVTSWQIFVSLVL